MLAVFPIIVAILCLAAGIALVWRGHWPRRVGDTPHCPGCDYVLTGIRIERCPECGRAIWRGNILLGECRRKASLTVAGSLLLLVTVGLLIVASNDFLQRIEWYHYRPAAWVIGDLDATWPATRDKAWAELQRRLLEGSLSPARQNALAERALREQQSSTTNGLTLSMMDFLGKRYLDHKLSQAQADAFFNNAMRLQLDARPIVGPGDPIPFRISAVGRGPSEGWWMRISEQTFWIDDRKIERGTSSGTGGFGGWSSTSHFDPQPPGKHRLRVSVEVGVGTGNFASAEGPLDRKHIVELTADVQVAAQSIPIKWTTSPSAATMEKYLSPVNFEVNAGTPPWLQGSIEAQNPPVNLAFEAFARIDGKDYSMGTITFRRSTGPNSNASYFVSVHAPPGDYGKIDLLLRSSERAVRETIDFTSAWQGEILLHDIPVRRAAAVSQPASKLGLEP